MKFNTAKQIVLTSYPKACPVANCLGDEKWEAVILSNTGGEALNDPIQIHSGVRWQKQIWISAANAIMLQKTPYIKRYLASPSYRIARKALWG